MSVFKNAIYRDNAFQWLARAVKHQDLNTEYAYSLLNFEVEEFGNFPVPHNLKPGNLEKQVRSQLVKVVDFINLKKVHHDKNFSNLTKILPRSKIGLHGVYHFIGKNWNEIFNPDKIQHHRHENESILHGGIFTLGLIASHHTPVDVAKRSNALSNDFKRNYEQGLFFLRELWSIKSGSHSRRYRNALKAAIREDQPIPPLDPKDRKILKNYHIWVHKATIIAKPINADYCYTITPGDLERIEKIIKGFSNARIYPFQAFNYNEMEINELSQAILNYQELCKSAFLKTNNQTAQILCRALDVVYHIEFSKITNDINQVAYNLQIDKFYKEGLDKIIDHNEFCRIVSSLPLNPKLEVLTQYKAMPQPDFDYFGAMERQRKLYQSHQARNRELFDERTFQEVIKYHKWLMIITYFKLHKTCPGHIDPTADFKEWHALYEQGRPERVPFREVNDIIFQGEFSWIPRTIDVVDLVKDKAICPKDVHTLKSGFEAQDIPIQNRNQLMDWVTRPDMPNLEILETNMDEERYSVRADDKPESKKPHGRWFFEAGTDARLIQSNYEESVSYYCKHFPGSCNGISVSEKIEKMGTLTAERYGDFSFKNLFVSFDIDKFSPALQLRVHQELDKQWAEAFGKPHLEQCSNIFLMGKIHYLKGPIHHIMDKMESDFEGFAGRKLTCYHCAVMGYTVRRLKERGLITGTSGFACLIDDGLLRLNVRAEGYLDTCAQIIPIIDEIYRKCSLVISWDKTFISEHTSLFLNDIRHHGRTIPLGLKACLKITAKSEALIPSLLDELQMVESTSRGAIVAGAPLVLVYSLYSWHIVDLIRKWGKKEYTTPLKNVAPVRAFLPVSFGGLGCVTGLHLEGSISAGGIEDNLSALQIIGYLAPKTKGIISSLLNAAINVKSTHMLAKNPDTIQTEARSLRSTRAHRVITRNLENVVKSPLLSSMLGFVRGFDSTFAEQAIANGACFPSELLDSLHRMEPVYAIEQFVLKFTKSTTASRICPYHALRECAMANVTEAALVVSAFYSN